VNSPPIAQEVLMPWFIEHIGHKAVLPIVIAAVSCFGGFVAADFVRTLHEQAAYEISTGAKASPYEPAGTIGFASMIEGVRPAVISIRARTLDDDVDRSVVRHPTRSPGPASPRYRIAQGSGFFISEDGYAVTNHHVVAGSSTIELRTNTDRSYKAKLVAADPVSDLALLKVDGGERFSHVSFSHRQPQVGEWVVAVGNPFGLGGTATAGIVSASGRDLPNGKDLLQIDAPVNRGNSGGPTFDLSGRVVGINTMILSPTGGWIGLGFAIPASRAERVIAQLKATGSVTRGWLGMRFQTISSELASAMGLSEPSGIVVADVMSAGPAAHAGVQVGDVIISMNDGPLANAHVFDALLEDTVPGTPITLHVVRAGADTTIEVVAESAPPAGKSRQRPETAQLNEGPQRLGLSLASASELADRSGGVMVVAIDPGGLAAGRGIEHRQVTTPEEVFHLVEDARKGEKQWVLLRVKSGESAQFTALPTS
jgi:serine protease Do